MKQRVITAVVLLALLAIVVWQINTPLFVAVIAFLSAVAANEIMKCAKVSNKFILVFGTAVAAVFPFFASPKVLEPLVSANTWGPIIQAIPNIVFIIAVVLVYLLAMLKGYSHTKFEDIAISVFASIIVPFGFSVFVRLRDMFVNEQFGIYLIFYALICALGREVQKEQTVALSGECADEIFGGYPWYHNRDILFDEAFPWSRSTDVRQSILKPGLLKHGKEFVHAEYLKTVNSTSYLESDSKTERRMREMFMLNMDWFMQTLLMRKDMMSMHCSLEVRVPFCDYRIVEYAYNMPWAFKSPQGREKGVLRKAFENELPYEIAWRKKSPYPKTHNPVYFKEVCKMADAVLADKSTPLCEMLNESEIRALMQDPDALKEPWYGQLMRGPQVLAYIVQIYYWIKDCNVNFI